MSRIKVVLAVLAVMVMVVASAAPAMADDNRHDGNRQHWNNWDNRAKEHNPWFINNHNNWNDRPLLANNYNDDCEWEFEEGWVFGPWGWQWGGWILDC
jgi:hypothetical protein